MKRWFVTGICCLMCVIVLLTACGDTPVQDEKVLAADTPKTQQSNTDGVLLRMPKRITVGNCLWFEETTYSCEDGRTLQKYVDMGDGPDLVDEIPLSDEQIAQLNTIYDSITDFSEGEYSCTIPVDIEHHDGTISYLSEGCAAQRDLNVYLGLLRRFAENPSAKKWLVMPDTITIDGFLGNGVLTIKPAGACTFTATVDDKETRTIALLAQDVMRLNELYTAITEYRDTDEGVAEQTVVITPEEGGETYEFGLGYASQDEVNQYIATLLYFCTTAVMA